MLVTFAGRFGFGLFTGAFAAALKDAFAYAAFITLIFGLPLSGVWVVLNAVQALRSRGGV